MAVAFSTNVSSAAATTTNIAIGITVSGTNPVLIGKVALDSVTATVTSATWSLGSGTTLEVKSLRNTNGPLSSIWAVPAPAGGAGTLTFGFSASIPAHCDTALWTGADQSTPCPTVDAVASSSNATNIVLTPANLTANDGTDAIGANIVQGNWVSATPNQRSIDNVSSPGILTGDATGTSAVTLTNDGTFINLDVASVAVRIKLAGSIPSTGAYQQEQSSTDRYQLEDGTGVYLIEPWGQTGVFLPPFMQGDLTGIGTPGRYFKDRLN